MDKHINMVDFAGKLLGFNEQDEVEELVKTIENIRRTFTPESFANQQTARYFLARERAILEEIKNCLTKKCEVQYQESHNTLRVNEALSIITKRLETK